VTLCAFVLYHATLLPGLDFGDTASFQVGVSSPIITPRDGYPLYFAISRLFLSLSSAAPAHAVNLASAVEGAVATGLFVLVAVELCGSTLAAIAAGLLFAGSYTFWSQSIIAEVYALHAVFATLTLLLILKWARRPTLGRLAMFFAFYALGFGNHLSMILLAPGFTVFLLLSAPNGWRSMFSPRVVMLAGVLACAGALQYAWNLRALWLLPYPPHTVADAAGRFWFDVTKADWRATMVMQVPRSMLWDRAAMYAFDLHQQFGWLGAAVAAGGLCFLFRTDWRQGFLMAALYGVNLLFAFGYNVGDSHVFYLPSHLMLALLVAPGLVLAGDIVQAPAVVAVLGLAFACARIYADYPALDRSHDDRPAASLASLTAGLTDRQAILLTDVNWQVQNGLLYFAQEIRPDFAYAPMSDVAAHLLELVADNQQISRDVLVTERARRTVADTYRTILTVVRDPRNASPSLLSAVTRTPPGVRYVLCVLKPTRDFALDRDDVARALAAVGDGTAVRIPDDDYVVFAGIKGQRPTLVDGADDPFSRTVDLAGLPVQIRMDSWLRSDTIRRMGYGHVVAGRHHSLIIERGVSYVTIDPRGEPLETAYAANIFGPEARYAVHLAPRP
jgi:hypothetical protein